MHDDWDMQISMIRRTLACGHWSWDVHHLMTSQWPASDRQVTDRIVTERVRNSTEEQSFSLYGNLECLWSDFDEILSEDQKWHKDLSPGVGYSAPWAYCIHSVQQLHSTVHHHVRRGYPALFPTLMSLSVCSCPRQADRSGTCRHISAAWSTPVKGFQEWFLIPEVMQS